MNSEANIALATLAKVGSIEAASTFIFFVEKKNMLVFIVSIIFTV